MHDNRGDFVANEEIGVDGGNRVHLTDEVMLTENFGVNEPRVENMNEGTEDQNFNEEVDVFEDIPELSDNTDDEHVKARENLRCFRELSNKQKECGKKKTKRGPEGSCLERPSTLKVYDRLLTSKAPCYNEDPFETSDDVSYITISDGSEVEHGKRRKARHKVYKDTEELINMPSIELGMIFRDKAEFKKAVDQLSIYERREIKWVKNDKKRYRTVCKHHDFWKWKILFLSQMKKNQDISKSKGTREENLERQLRENYHNIKPRMAGNKPDASNQM